MEMSFAMIRARIEEDTGAADSAERRRASRFDLDVEGRVRELGTTGVDARILNISETGFMAECAGEFEVGARVWLMLPGRDRANAVVKWTAGHRLGAEFTEPVSVEDLRVADGG